MDPRQRFKGMRPGADIPGMIREGTSIELDPSLAHIQICPRCKGQYFIPVIEFHEFSAISNPTGKDITVTKQTFICVECHTPKGAPLALLATPTVEERRGKND